jgi:hypothetical protein
VRRLRAAERRDRAVLDQNVVEREDDLAVRRGPVFGIGGDHEDVAVEAHLLAVVLPDVRVIPVQARVREGDARREALADRDRRLRLVGAVVAVLQPQPVPVHGRLQVTLVDDVDLDLRSLRHPQRGARDRAVVGQHPHRRVAQLLGDRRDLQIERVAVG